MSQSKAAEQAEELAPQAFAAAEKLRIEAQYLHSEHRHKESEAAGAQALAAYNEAFALAQLAIAQERLSAAEAERQEAAAELSKLDMLEAQVEGEAESYEMQVRAVLDQEEVKDAEHVTPARAEARRLAAKQLASEAGLLCLGAQLLQTQSDGLASTMDKVKTLEGELNVGSTKQDLYPRAADLRAACLKEITLARRPETQQAPQSARSDTLLTGISSAGKYMVYRDDRGVVVNLGKPLAGGADSDLSEFAAEALSFLGATSKNYGEYPLLVVVHTPSRGQQQRATHMGELAQQALKEAGASNVTVKSVENAQPVVLPSLHDAASMNERIEIVFVVKGR